MLNSFPRAENRRGILSDVAAPLVNHSYTEANLFSGHQEATSDDDRFLKQPFAIDKYDLTQDRPSGVNFSLLRDA
jgi:hypothetical protein